MIALRELMMHRELGLELRTAEGGLDVSLRWTHVVEDAVRSGASPGASSSSAKDGGIAGRPIATAS